jgi:hypothetical protein
MTITIKIPEGSPFEARIRQLMEEKKEIREQIKKGNIKIYEEKGYKLVKPI